MPLEEIQAWLAMPYTQKIRAKLDKKREEAEKMLHGKPFAHPNDLYEVRILQLTIDLAKCFLDDVDKELATELRHEKAKHL